MLTGLLEPSGGTVLLDGVDIRADMLRYKHRLGYVPEEAQLYTWMSGAEYLTFCARLRGLPAALTAKRIDALLEIFGLQLDRDAPMSAYSKGMRQKILLSAALLHNPRVLVLDEPESGLDVQTALVLRAAVRALADDRRIIFYSSHQLETIEKISTRVIILRAGVIVADDSALRLRDLMQAPSLEDVFSQLTVTEDTEQLACELLETVRC
jgi:ABC-2 type transport system ATP-binding protein